MSWCRICDQEVIYATTAGDHHRIGHIFDPEPGVGSWIRIEDGRYRNLRGRGDGVRVHRCSRAKSRAYFAEDAA